MTNSNSLSLKTRALFLSETAIKLTFLLTHKYLYFFSLMS